MKYISNILKAVIINLFVLGVCSLHAAIIDEEPVEALMRHVHFEDMRYHPAQRYVNELVDRGVVNDNDLFSPEERLSAVGFEAWASAIFGGNVDVLSNQGDGVTPSEAVSSLEAIIGEGVDDWLPESVEQQRYITKAEGAEIILRAYWDPARYATPRTSADIYVSLAGNDEWSGSLPVPNDSGTDGPIASPEKAISLVADMLSEGSKEIVVLFREGRYQLDRPMHFGRDEFKGDHRSIIFKNYGDEIVTISGGVIQAGWKSVDSNPSGALWESKITDETIPTVRQLIANRQRMPVARYPNDALLNVATVDNGTHPRKFTFTEDLPEFTSPYAEFIDTSYWASRRVRINESDTGWLETVHHVGVAPWHLSVTQPGNKVYLENSPEFISQPWDWSLNSDGKSILWLVPAEYNPNDLNVTVPKLERLLVIEGDPEREINNLIFVGLNFSDSISSLPEMGISELQATFYSDALSKTDDPRRVDRLYTMPSAVTLTYAKGVKFVNNHFQGLGNNGINMGEGTRYCGLLASEVYDVGGTGIQIGAQEVWGDGTEAEDPQDGRSDWKKPEQVPYGNLIINNRIHDCGRIVFGGQGIWAGYTKFTCVSRNSVFRLPYTGISIGWSFFSGMTSMEYPLVEHNHVHDVMRVLTDGGGIYMLGYQPGGVLRFNRVHDVWRNYDINGYFAHGLYFDEASRYWHIYGNVLYDTYHPLKLNNYLRNPVYENVDYDGNVISNKKSFWLAERRFGGFDWLKFSRNNFGADNPHISAGRLASIDSVFATPHRDHAKLYEQPLLRKVRIIGKREFSNNSFELSDIDGWSVADHIGGGGDLDLLESKDDAHHGEGYLRLNRHFPHDPIITPAISLKKGMSYRLRFALRQNGGAPANIRVYKDSTRVDVISDIATKPNQWTEVDEVFAIKDTIDTRFVIQIVEPASGRGPIDLDSIHIEEIIPYSSVDYWTMPEL